MQYKSYTVEEAKRKLESYCVYQERCHDEVQQKLRELNMIPQAADLIIAHLIEYDFLNEERFAASFARGKHRIKYWGRVRIINELKARHISQYNITRALKEINDNEYLTVFDELLHKQWEQVKEVNIYKKKNKVMNFLLRKGYETNLIHERLNELSK